MKYLSLITLAFFLTFGLAAQAEAQQISGQYIETRSADVYTGPCFANAEVDLVGNQAILGWHVNRGSWDGVPLDGLSVVGVVRASGTLGDPNENPYPAKAVMIVDEHATPPQRQALVSFAQHMSGKLLSDVVRVVAAPIEVDMPQGHHSGAFLRAGSFAVVETRALDGQDEICGNEMTWYPPLAQVAHAMPAAAATDEYQGPGLGATWTLHDKRSAFVGTFSTGTSSAQAAPIAGN
jgi:hypothetical protein